MNRDGLHIETTRPPSQAEFPHRGEIRSLTGIRGIASCWVVAYHFSDHEFLGGRLRNLLEHGYLAVDLFFVLSGFVIGLTASKPFSTGISSKAYLHFICLRLARIWPLYALLTVLSAVACRLGLIEVKHGDLSVWMTIITNLLAIQSWGITASIVGPAWSISTEFAAYLIFPFLIIYAAGGGAKRTVAVYMVLLVALTSLVLIPGQISGVHGEHGPLDISQSAHFGALLRCLLEFAMGVAAFRLHRTPIALRLSRSNAMSCILLAVICVLLMINSSDLLVAALFSILIVHLSSDESWASRLFAWRPIHWLGIISYALYLVHMLIKLSRPDAQIFLERIHTAHSWSLSYLAIFFFSVGAAALLHYFVERPSRSYLRRLFARRFA